MYFTDNKHAPPSLRLFLGLLFLLRLDIADQLVLLPGLGEDSIVVISREEYVRDDK